MAVVSMSRGVTATLMDAQTGTGAAADEFRLPMDYAGARMAFQFVITTATVKIEATLDGTNWVDFPDTNAVGVTSSKIVVSISQGISGIRANATANTGSATVKARLQ